MDIINRVLIIKHTDRVTHGDEMSMPFLLFLISLSLYFSISLALAASIASFLALYFKIYSFFLTYLVISLLVEFLIVPFLFSTL